MNSASVNLCDCSADFDTVGPFYACHMNFSAGVPPNCDIHTELSSELHWWEYSLQLLGLAGSASVTMLTLLHADNIGRGESGTVSLGFCKGLPELTPTACAYHNPLPCVSPGPNFQSAERGTLTWMGLGWI